MPEVAVENLTCYNCGAGVRENTAYCYNCGVPIANRDEELAAEIEEVVFEQPPVDDKTKAALDDLAEKLKLDEEEDKKLAKAAAERRRARVSQRNTAKEFTWESGEDSPGALLLLATLLFAIFAGVVVLFTVFWK